MNYVLKFKLCKNMYILANSGTQNSKNWVNLNLQTCQAKGRCTFAWRGVVRFLLHAKQANFFYFAYLGDFSQRFSVK